MRHLNPCFSLLVKFPASASCLTGRLYMFHIGFGCSQKIADCNQEYIPIYIYIYSIYLLMQTIYKYELLTLRYWRKEKWMNIKLKQYIYIQYFRLHSWCLAWVLDAWKLLMHMSSWCMTSTCSVCAQQHSEWVAWCPWAGTNWYIFWGPWLHMALGIWSRQFWQASSLSWHKIWFENCALSHTVLQSLSSYLEESEVIEYLKNQI